ncbi:YfhO family protein [Robiginitalea sediminis]|uniref:YfhO family protein n=1 Tax=Robiginitalea sediminis TaxID=1982593 RepID=UPI000B4C085A|nr:YfhO family protein [Robiginitalea sediminis]
MNLRFKQFLTHFFVLVFFALAALAYFHPVLQGKVIYQSDIVQFRGMAREQEDFRDKTGEEPYWTNSAFGGMPTYQLGARYPNDYVKKLDRVIRFLPRPADYLFLYFLGFYILMCCMKVDTRLAVIGALAYGFSTYLIIILGVGHNAKAHALGYLPMLLGGILLVFRKKYLWGFVLTALAMALEVQANHYQMTYYFMLLVVLLGLAYLVDAIRKRVLGHYFLSVGILVLAVGLGILANATSLLATREYAAWSTRGPSALTLDPEGNPKTDTNGLDKEYITQYSYGLSESLNLFVPRLFGGGSVEALGSDSKTYKFLVEQGISRSQALDFSNELPLYWGEQPGVAAPAYIGAIILFFFLLGLLLVRGRAKWWLAGGFVLSLMLSWGKNFPAFTNLMIDYFPLYDKFRAVSSAQVILELCAPILGILGLRELLRNRVEAPAKQRSLLIAFAILSGLSLALIALRGSFDFAAGNDEILRRYFSGELVDIIRADRKAVYLEDTFRSFLLVGVAALLCWLYLKGRLGRNLLAGALGALVVFDLVGVNLRYVNQEDFVAERRMNAPIAKSQADQLILQDSSIYRVLNVSEGLNGARTSYFHQSLGGYHAAKPARMQDLFEYHIYRDNRQVLNMLNTKYLIQPDEEGAPSVALNPNALGNAWFVEQLIPVPDADAAMAALDTLDVVRHAVVNTADFPEMRGMTFPVDSTASVRLESYAPNRLVYQAENPQEGVLVFSEMYYPHGWKAYVDGNPVSHFRVNYALRASRIPAGNHKVEFRFEPEVVLRGSGLALAGSIGLAVAFLAALVFSIVRSPRVKEEE